MLSNQAAAAGVVGSIPWSVLEQQTLSGDTDPHADPMRATEHFLNRRILDLDIAINVDPMFEAGPRQGPRRPARQITQLDIVGYFAHV
jgi:hypothetical protein